jgi:hypothetical protein
VYQHLLAKALEFAEKDPTLPLDVLSNLVLDYYKTHMQCEDLSHGKGVGKFGIFLTMLAFRKDREQLCAAAVVEAIRQQLIYVSYR